MSTAVYAFQAPVSSGPIVTRVHADLSTMTGVSVETGSKVFDPLGLAEWGDLEYLRASELANGRCAMLAFLGWCWPQFVGTFPGGPAQGVTDPIEAISKVPPAAWAQMLVAGGVFEAWKYNHAQGVESVFGEGQEVFFDPAGIYPKDQAGQEKMELAELKNGRMAMIAFAGLVTHHYMPDAVPLIGNLK